MTASPFTITPMSITPSVPVLHGRKNTELRFDGSALLLRRAHKEHHIPLAAVARVHGERRTVEVVLRAPDGSRPVVHRIEDVGESAATAFAGAVNTALPDVSDPAADGSALVRVRTLDSENARARKRRWVWLGALAFVLVHVVEGMLVTAAGSPDLSILIGLGGFCSGALLLTATSLMPFGKPQWRLHKDGVTVVARYEGHIDGMYVYNFTALDGRPYAYAPYDYRGEQVELVYDAADPFNGVERQFVLGRGTLLFPMLLFGVPGLLVFLGTLALLFAA
ncbi:hypothetical protein RKD49_004260 [Streptomyces glaucescens]